jgi:hypothetical protein
MSGAVPAALLTTARHIRRTERDGDMNPNSGNARADAERARLKRAWPEAFTDGERGAFLQRFAGERERGGYPHGFHGWPLECRNTWYCGFNFGLIERQRALLEAANG